MAQPPGESAPANGRKTRSKRSISTKRKTAAAKKSAPAAKNKASAKRKSSSRRTTPPVPKIVIRTVTAGVERDLAAIAGRDPALAESALATVARALAREIDTANNSATSKSMCAKALQDVLEQLRELAPPEEARDGVDDIIERHSGAHLRAV